MKMPCRSVLFVRGGGRGFLLIDAHVVACIVAVAIVLGINLSGAAADGRRLGRGGGYYDRFLAQYTGDALLLCRERLLCPSIPQETHDIRVPAVVTEQGRLE